MSDNYPLPSFHFRVDFLFPNESVSDTECRFSSVSGIGTTVEYTDYKELGSLYNKLKLPVSRSYDNLVLERGLITLSRIFQWFQQSYYDLQVELIPILVCLLNEKHSPTLSWLFFDAYPVNWKYSKMDALKNEYLVETITIGYSNFIELKNSDNKTSDAFISDVKSRL